MDTFPCRPAEPEGTDYEERASDTREWQATHFFVLRPRALQTLCASENGVPGEVHDRRDEGADADGQEGETSFAAVEAVDAGED